MSWYDPEYNLVGANFKCIALSLGLAGFYWWAPPKNKFILVGILYFTYLALAYYDVWYECQRNLKPTFLAYLYSWAKPKGKQRDEWESWPESLKRKIRFWDTVVIAIIISLTPAFIAWQPK